MLDYQQKLFERANQIGRDIRSSEKPNEVLSGLDVTAANTYYNNALTHYKHFIRLMGQISGAGQEVQPVIEARAPIKIDALVDQPNRDQAIGSFTVENTTRLEVFIQARDLLGKGFEPEPGDFFLYGEEVFEILTANQIGDVFGQAEYNIYWKLDSKLARSGRFDLPQFKKMLGHPFFVELHERVDIDIQGF